MRKLYKSLCKCTSSSAKYCYKPTLLIPVLLFAGMAISHYASADEIEISVKVVRGSSPACEQIISEKKYQGFVQDKYYLCLPTPTPFIIPFSSVAIIKHYMSFFLIEDVK